GVDDPSRAVAIEAPPDERVPAPGELDGAVGVAAGDAGAGDLRCSGQHGEAQQKADGNASFRHAPHWQWPCQARRSRRPHGTEHAGRRGAAERATFVTGWRIADGPRHAAPSRTARAYDP